MTFTGNDAYRFLGGRGMPPPDELAKLTTLAKRVEAVSVPRFTARFYTLALDPAAEHIDFLDHATGELAFALTSHHLSRNLANCSHAWLFAATLGPGPDSLLRRAEALGDIAEGARLQAVAGELADDYCNDVCAILANDPRAAGTTQHPRFSPGYGDVPLAFQRTVFAQLDLPRALGLTLTDGNLMIPTKSVTAFVGVESGDDRR